MSYTVWVLLVLMSFMRGSAAAQELAPGHVDPWPVLRAAAKAIGDLSATTDDVVFGH